MDDQHLRYGVVISDNNADELKDFLYYFEGIRSQVEQTSPVHVVSGLDEIGISRRQVKSVTDLAEIAYNLDIYLARGKRKAVDFVSENLGLISLVLMNRSNSHSPQDLNGFQAAEAMRHNGYRGFITLQTRFPREYHIAQARMSGVNDFFQKGDTASMLDYIVDKYRLNQKMKMTEVSIRQV